MTQAPRIILVNSLGEEEQELSVLLLFRIATLGGGMPGGVKVYQVQEVVGGFLPKITADLKSPQRNRWKMDLTHRKLNYTPSHHLAYRNNYYILSCLLKVLYSTELKNQTNK